MIDIKNFCNEQKKKISFYTIVIVVAILSMFVCNVTIVTKNAIKKASIDNKKNKINEKRSDLMKIKKLVNSYNNEIGVLPRKNGYYIGLNKQKFIEELNDKMNYMNDLDVIDDFKNTRINMDYSSFLARFVPNITDVGTYKKIEELINMYNRVEKLNLNVFLDMNTLTISFFADYEYVVYKMLKMIQNIMPGYLIIKSISVKPANETVKTMLYNRKFKNDTNHYNVDNRLSCEIEFEWIFLAKYEQQ